MESFPSSTKEPTQAIIYIYVHTRLHVAPSSGWGIVGFYDFADGIEDEPLELKPGHQSSSDDTTQGRTTEGGSTGAAGESRGELLS